MSSFNQSRPDESEQQYRNSGRSFSSNPQWTYSGAYGKGAGGGIAPSPSVCSSSSLSSKDTAKGLIVLKQFLRQRWHRMQKILFSASKSIEVIKKSSDCRFPVTPSDVRFLLYFMRGGNLSICFARSQSCLFPELSQDWKARLKIPPPDTCYKTEINSADASGASSLQFGSISPGFLKGIQTCDEALKCQKSSDVFWPLNDNEANTTTASSKSESKVDSDRVILDLGPPRKPIVWAELLDTVKTMLPSKAWNSRSPDLMPDAVYCAMFVHTLHSLGTLFFNTVNHIDVLISETLQPMICCCTEYEAGRLGRFLYETLKIAYYWKSDESVYECECGNMPGFAVYYRYPNSHCVTYEQFIKVGIVLRILILDESMNFLQS
ncbi:hypothetical protein CCACVL1_13420 [Corchorus capsularis]|uniref:THO complex subunitTHOC2 C-terminal domain-containing protein n=1 Tax=Corchorus capsularis TaxID=210143 RepID=A0A1R3IB45_COCAP|nr:hypothetical protein CCACVL1_13420 [Corchorus capsularis]